MTPDAFEGRAIVFDGPEDYHARIDDPALGIDETSILVMRGAGPVGYPGSAEVVNMQPPAALIRAGVRELPTIGDGRQSGTSGSPSILNASPGERGRRQSRHTGNGRIASGWTCGRAASISCCRTRPLAARRAAYDPPVLENHTPWEELYRSHVGQLAEGGCLEFATRYRRVAAEPPRHSH